MLSPFAPQCIAADVSAQFSPLVFIFKLDFLGLTPISALLSVQPEIDQRLHF